MLEFFIINKNIFKDESTFHVKYEIDAKPETNVLNLERHCCYNCQKHRSYHADKKDIPLILLLRAPFICLRKARTLRVGP